jgi:hypothetical protein
VKDAGCLSFKGPDLTKNFGGQEKCVNLAGENNSGFTMA